MGRWLCRGGDAFFPGGFETTKAWVLCFSFLDLDHLAMVFGIIGLWKGCCHGALNPRRWDFQTV
jgi:hypothetical protein